MCAHSDRIAREPTSPLPTQGPSDDVLPCFIPPFTCDSSSSSHVQLACASRGARTSSRIVFLQLRLLFDELNWLTVTPSGPRAGGEHANCSVAAWRAIGRPDSRFEAEKARAIRRGRREERKLEHNRSGRSPEEED